MFTIICILLLPLFMGRLTRNPEVRYSQGENAMAVARRGRREENGQNADFINCVAFGRNGEFAEKYLRKGVRILISGRIQTGSYTNRDGQKVYTTDIVVEEQEFAESKGDKNNQSNVSRQPAPQVDENGFMNIPDGIDDELPFS